MWDLSGKKLYTFEGHDAQVYSICPHQKENIQVDKQASLVYKDPKLSFFMQFIFFSFFTMQFIFSTALDGKIKAWLYDNVGSRVDYDAPGQWCTTMLYSADGSRSILLI